jgi:hypothetical protein
MKTKQSSPKRFAICVDNSGYLVSLELNKVYTVLPDDRAAEDDCLRVVDESGEDYLYSAKRFVLVDLPERVKRSVMRRSRELTILANSPLPQRSGKQRKLRQQRSSRLARG